MGKIKADLHSGLWPEAKAASASHTIGLTHAARGLAESTVNELRRLGVEITLDDDGKARFRTPRMLSGAARRSIETRADLIERWLQDKWLQERQGQ